MYMKYYIYYVEYSTPKIETFRTKKAQTSFIKKFKTDFENGCWIDLVFKGKIIYKDPTFKFRGL